MTRETPISDAKSGTLNRRSSTAVTLTENKMLLANELLCNRRL